MCVDIRKKVLKILEDYPATKRKIALLRYELEHPQQITSDELIGALNFAHGDGSMPSAPGNISNKTMYIAMSYQEKAAVINSEILDNISTKLFDLEREIDRLHHYVMLLDKKHREIITLYYFDQFTREEIAETKASTSRSIQRLKDDAVNNLVAMYEFTHSKKNIP